MNNTPHPQHEVYSMASYRRQREREERREELKFWFACFVVIGFLIVVGMIAAKLPVWIGR